MAEFPDVGAHCSFTTCNLLDFLPLTCQACKKQFCGVHYSAHECCNKVERVIPDELAKKSFQLYVMCSSKGCFAKELSLIKCGTCGYNFCHNHRNLESHNCCNQTTAVKPKPVSNVVQPAKTTKSSSVSMEYAPISLDVQPLAKYKFIGMIRHKQRMITHFSHLNTLSFFIHVNEHLFPIIVPKNWTVNHALTSVLEQCNFGTDSSNKRAYIASLNDEPLPDCKIISEVVNERDELKLVLN